MPTRRKVQAAAPPPLLKATVDRVEVKVDSIANAVERLVEATTALLQVQAHPATTLVPQHSTTVSQRAQPITPAPPSARIEIPVPQETEREAETIPAAPSVTLPQGNGIDFNAALAAELAAYAEEDEEPPPPPTDDQIFAQWADRMTMWAQNRMWPESWGPRPGQDGCEVPTELLRAGRR